MPKTALHLVVLAVCALACQGRMLLKEEGNGSTLNSTAKAQAKVDKFCSIYGEGIYADITSKRPLCSTTFISCNADNKTGTVVEDMLGVISTPYNATVEAVFNAFSMPGGPALPGAIGTVGCDCDELYSEDEITAMACKVCMALQLNNLCDTKLALENPSYSCAVPIPKNPALYINCGLSGPWIQNGTLVVDKETAQVVLGALQDD